MKKTSKFLAVALAVLMLMMTSITAFADGETYLLETNEMYDVYVPGESYTYFGFIAEESGCYVIDTFITEYDEAADPYIEVYDDDGNMVAYNDDCYGLESAVVFYAEEGEYYVIYCSDASNTEDSYYCISITETCADFSQDGYCDSCRDLLCSHNCHKGGIVGFFWKITNFFNKLFGINEYCECGAYHW